MINDYFISHMVQMKVAHEDSLEIEIENFISHMVQVKAEVAERLHACLE